MDVDETDALLALAVQLASDAAELLLEGLKRERVVVDTKTTGTDMVTEIDHASERLIVDGILQARPDDGILGEEGTDRAGTSGIRWVIDPIDGTTNYLYGHPGFAVSIAVEIDGIVSVGVVNDPLHGEVFTATSGGGSFRNGMPITVSTQADLANALVATGFSYESDRRRRQAEVLGKVIPHIRDIRRMGAASVDLCSVACGRIDAYWERGLQPWDHAAGALIATEAGAIVGNLEGGGPEFDFCLAGPPGLFAPLRDLLASSGAADA